MTDISIVAGTILNFVDEEKISLKSEDIHLHLDEPVDVVNETFGRLIREIFQSDMNCQ